MPTKWREKRRVTVSENNLLPVAKLKIFLKQKSAAQP
jgi:hypothetical protein